MGPSISSKRQATAPALHRFKVFASTMAGMIAMSALAIEVHAAAGDLDRKFGDGGKITTDFGNGASAIGIAIQPDGKIVAAGTAAVSPTNVDFALARYHRDGSLDTGFGEGGKVTTDILGGFDATKAIAIQKDGKIVVAGQAETGQSPENDTSFALVRYNGDGSLDSSFGTGGKVTTDFGRSSAALGVVIQENGKIVAAGGTVIRGYSSVYYGLNGFMLARYHSDGSRDIDFGAGGLVIANSPAGIVGANGVVLSRRGKITVAGGILAPNDSEGNPRSNLALARFNRDGTLDPSFGTGGLVTTDIIGLLGTLGLQSNGQIVVGGHIPIGLNAHFALARFKSDGSPDADFGNGGMVTTDFQKPNGEPISIGVDAIAIQRNGKIVAAGGALSCPSGTSSGPVLALARYKKNGSLDARFAQGGKVIFDGFSVSGVALQRNGKIVTAGGTCDAFALVRFLSR